MKWTKKKVLYNVLQLVFYGVVPLALIFMLYGNLGDTKAAVGFKLAAPGILLLVLAFLSFKKVFISRKLADAHAQLNTLKADLKVKTESAEVKNIENAVKTIGTAEVLLGAIVPVLLFALLILCCVVMEEQLVKMSGTCGFILLSYLAGTVFAVLDAREIKSKNLEKEEKESA